MAFETKNFFNSTIKQIYQQTGAILSLSSRSDKQLLINSLKLFEANFVYNWQKIVYPLLHGPVGSPHSKYTGMRSKPWAEYDALDTVYGGASGWTLTAEPWATEDSIPALWDGTNKQPHSITGALYYLSERIEDLTVENDEQELPQYDDREVKADVLCLEKNLETVYKDVYGCGYSLDCDGAKQNQFSIQTHLFQIFNQLIDGGPQLSIVDSCEDIYPSMSVYMPVSGLTYDVKIPNSEISGVCGASLIDDLNLIQSYIGMNNCETSPTYSDYGTLIHLTDGSSLEESIWDLDNAIASFSATKSLQEAYIDGWANTSNRAPGFIAMYNNPLANTSEGFRLHHGTTLPSWVNGSAVNVINNNTGEYFEDYMFLIQDLALNGYNYFASVLALESTHPDHWHNNFSVGEHEVGRNAGVSLPNPGLKFGDYLYPSVHLYRSVLNQTPTSGIPRTRELGQTYSGYTQHEMNETAIWVATGANRDGALWTSLPVNQQPLDCEGNIVSANNLYYRQPGDGTIFKLNKCQEILPVSNVSSIYESLTTSVSSVVVTSVRSDTGASINHNSLNDALSIRLSSTNSAKVGIGLADPDTKLHISTDNDGEGIKAINASTGAAFEAKYIAGAGYGYQLKLDDNNNATTVFLRSYGDSYFNTGGNFGIGLASPVETLDVNGGVRIGNSSGTNVGTIRWSGTDLEAYKAGGWVSLTASGGGSASPAGNNGQLQYNNNGSFGSTTGIEYNTVFDGGGLEVTQAYGITFSDNAGDSTENYIKIKAPVNVGSNYILVLPNSAPSNGQVLTATTPSGANNQVTLNWSNQSSGGIASLAADATPQLGGDLDANGNDIDMGTNVITDTAVGQWSTAYGWGDHSAAGYTSNAGTVTSITAGTGLSGNTITGSGTIALENTSVSAGSYTNADITVDAQGRVTAATNGTSGSGLTSGGGLIDYQNVTNIHNAFGHTNISTFILYKGSATSNNTVKLNAKKGFSAGDTLHITNTFSEGSVNVELVGTDNHADSTLLSNWKVPPASGNGALSAANTIALGSGKTIKAVCISVSSASGATFAATVI